LLDALWSARQVLARGPAELAMPGRWGHPLEGGGGYTQ